MNRINIKIRKRKFSSNQKKERKKKEFFLFISFTSHFISNMFSEVMLG